MVVLLCKVMAHIHSRAAFYLTCLQHPLTSKYDLSSVRYLMSGAAPLSAEITQLVAKILPECSIGQGYGTLELFHCFGDSLHSRSLSGMTETFTTIAVTPDDQRIATLGCAGVLLPGITARVVKPDGTLAKRGEPGELVLTGPSMAWGYFKNPKASVQLDR